MVRGNPDQTRASIEYSFKRLIIGTDFDIATILENLKPFDW